MSDDEAFGEAERPAPRADAAYGELGGAGTARALASGDGQAGEPAAHLRALASPLVDRAISPVAGRLGGGLAARALSVAALGLGCGVFALASWRHAAPKPKIPPEPAAQIVPFEPAKPEAPAAPTLARPGADAPSLGTQAEGSGGADGPSAAAPSGPPNPGAGETAAQSAAQNRVAQRNAIRAAPILAFSDAAAAREGAAGFSPALGGGDEAVGGVRASLAAPAPAAAASELDQLRQGSTIGLVRARRLPDRDFLITAGSLIACTLMTAMDTAAPGYVSCLIGQDVYSDNGRVVLLEKGSKVFGEYRSGLRQGQGRLFVLWSRIVTPGGAAISLASPASDALGRAGFDGRIDSHFWTRFGAALMFSIVDDGASAIAPRAPAGASLVRLPSEAASIALENSVNIAPSLIKPQGSEVAIFVASDLDFSSVYQLKAR